jgi:hypothetical protein
MPTRCPGARAAQAHARAELELMAERVLIGHTRRPRLVQHRHQLSPCDRRREAAALHDRDAHRLEVVRRHQPHLQRQPILFVVDSSMPSRVLVEMP